MYPHFPKAKQDEPDADLSYPDKPRAWRRERLVGIGFTEQQAEVLADTRDGNGIYVYWADVKRLFLDNGCDHNTAFDILSHG